MQVYVPSAIEGRCTYELCQKHHRIIVVMLDDYRATRGAIWRVRRLVDRSTFCSLHGEKKKPSTAAAPTILLTRERDIGAHFIHRTYWFCR